FYTNTSNPVTIYPRISESATGCGDVNSLQINVIPAPEITQPDDIKVCDDDQDGMAIIDLTQVYSQLVNSTSNRTFTFYDTNQDLEQGINPYTDIDNFVTNSNLIHVKGTNTMTGCWSKAPFQLYVKIVPTIPVLEDYTFCEMPSDGLGECIFVPKDAEMLNRQTGKRVKYYLSQEDADNRLNNIN